MKIEVINNHEYDKAKQDLVIVGIHDKLDELAADYDDLTGHKISKLIESGDISTSVGSSFLFVTDAIPGGRILLIGLGKKENFNRKAFGKVAKAVASNIVDKKYDAIRFRIFLQLENHSLEVSEYIRDLTLAVRDAEYSFDTFKSKQTPTNSPNTLYLTMGQHGDIDRLKQEQQIAEAVAHGIKMTKDLGNTPSNVCTPTWLGEQARLLELNDSSYRTRVDVLGIDSIKELKMNSFLSVAQGSAEEPKLIIVKYNGADDANEEPIALVGKGITFDSGGISIKPSSGMNEMKYDMLGAATVIGVIKAIQQIGLKKNVVGVIPTCENMPSGTSVKPGDIVTSMSGITIENNNTDAEGRLILCDALTFTQRKLNVKPTFVIDMATLTGAICVSLGSVHTGLFTKDDILAENLIHAGSQTQDTLWEMPMDDAFDDMLKTNHADVANVGGRDGGSSSAACFLARFIEDGTRWAHLDIAGTASIGGKDKHATGRPVHMLVQFLINMQ